MVKNNIYIHPSSVVSEDCNIGEGTKIWHFCHIREGASIGNNVTIGQNVYIDQDVVIGDNCKIQNNVSIYKGVSIGDNVFIGPSVVFTNDLYPMVENWNKNAATETIVENNVSLGANSTIIAGIKIGEFSLIGAGSVVTNNITKNTLAYGNPAKIASDNYRKE